MKTGIMSGTGFDPAPSLPGKMTNGTTLWLTGPKTIEQYSVPLLRLATSEAGRSAPRAVAGPGILHCGDEASLPQQLQQSVTDLRAAPMELDPHCYELTLQFLASEL